MPSNVFLTIGLAVISTHWPFHLIMLAVYLNPQLHRSYKSDEIHASDL